MDLIKAERHLKLSEGRGNTVSVSFSLSVTGSASDFADVVPNCLVPLVMAALGELEQQGCGLIHVGPLL